MVQSKQVTKQIANIRFAHAFEQIKTRTTREERIYYGTYYLQLLLLFGRISDRHPDHPAEPQSVRRRCNENWFDLVEKELPEFVETNFPISDKKEDRYVAGLSMGGYGALVHGLKHPERFTAIGAFSPAVVMPQMAEENGGIALGHTIPPMIKAEDLVDDLLAKKAEFPKIFLCIGHNDFLYESVEAFHQKLVKDGVEHRYDSVPGYEHEWAFWDLELPMFLDWIPRNDAYAKMDRRKM